MSDKQILKRSGGQINLFFPREPVSAVNNKIEPQSTITKIVSEAHSSQPYSCSNVRPGDVEKLREEYLEMIIRPDWFDIFISKLPQELNNPGRQSITISLDGINKEVKFPFYIGRMSPPEGANHILLPHNTGSRCHAFVLSVGDELYVVDLGSLLGIKTLKRSLNVPLDHSFPRLRSILKFHKDEKIVLDMGGALIGFNITDNAQECTVCFMEPRTERLQTCGHLVACSDCLNKVSKCPVCRKPFLGNTDRQMSIRINSYRKLD